MKNAVDWKKIKRAYVTHTEALSPAQLADKFGLAESTVRKYMREENWETDRKEYHGEAIIAHVSSDEVDVLAMDAMSAELEKRKISIAHSLGMARGAQKMAQTLVDYLNANENGRARILSLKAFELSAYMTALKTMQNIVAVATMPDSLMQESKPIEAGVTLAGVEHDGRDVMALLERFGVHEIEEAKEVQR